MRWFCNAAPAKNAGLVVKWGVATGALLPTYIATHDRKSTIKECL